MQRIHCLALEKKMNPRIIFFDFGNESSLEEVSLYLMGLLHGSTLSNVEISPVQTMKLHYVRSTGPFQCTVFCDSHSKPAPFFAHSHTSTLSLSFATCMKS